MKGTIKYFLLGLTFCVSSLSSSGQQNKIDSILTLLKTDKPDTNKLIHLTSVADEYNFIGSYNSAMLYANSALQLCNVILKETTDSKILQIVKKKEAFTYNIIGLIYTDQGNYPEALKKFFASLKIKEAFGDKNGEAATYNNIGNVYDAQGNFPAALKNYFACLKIMEVIGDKAGIASSFNNIGNVYAEQGNYPEALENYFACLKIKDAMGDKTGEANPYNNIGSVYDLQGNYKEALNNFFAALKIREKLGDKAGIAASYVNIGVTFRKQKKYKEADEYLIKAKDLSKKIGYKENLRNAFFELTELDSSKGNFKEAFENHKLYTFYRDSLNNEEAGKKIIQSQMTFDFEKKEAVANAEHKKELENQQSLADEKSKKQKFVIVFIFLGLLLVIVFAGFIFRSLRLTRKQKNIIEVKSKETERQKLIIEEKNKDITDSINYAKRIQHAKLPRKEDIYSVLPNSFVLFKPKDIVSGDFYFFHNNPSPSERGRGEVFIASADCTGHGIPGAFMSMIGSEKLEDAVLQTSDTSEILKLLNKGIKTSLRQSDSGESTRDGMDIALVRLDLTPLNNAGSDSATLHYAGANRSIWIIRKGQTEIEEIKATKKAIGGLTDNNQHFDSHELKLQQGDTFYIFTDGYTDQFGGRQRPNDHLSESGRGQGKKLMTKKFKEILLNIQTKSMKEQEQYLDDFMENWKAGAVQVDDILVIGVRL